MDRLLVLAGICVLGSAFWFPGKALADDDEFDRSPVDCIVVNRIRRTEVVDDQSILFFMRGSQIYRAMLPYTCPGLAREGRFGYQVRGSQLCSTDTITVIERSGFGNTGMTCRLGHFYATTMEAVQELRGVPQPQPQVEMVPIPPAQQPDEDHDTQD